MHSTIQDLLKFQFQTGSILAYNVCFNSKLGVNFDGIMIVVRVYRQYFAKFGKLSWRLSIHFGGRKQIGFFGLVRVGALRDS